MSKKSNKIKGMSVRVKIVGLGTLSILISILVVAIISYTIASDNLKKQAYNNLEAVNNLKGKQISKFFAERIGDVKVLANNPYTKRAFHELNLVYDAAGSGKSGNFKGLNNEKFVAPKEYVNVHNIFFPVFKHYMKEYGYYDIFLLHKDDGDVFFTVSKEADFGTIASEIKSSLHDVWRKAREGK